MRTALSSTATAVALGLLVFACSDSGNDPESLSRESAALRATPPIRVCARGCDYTEIQPAIDAAVSGAVIRVYRGNYAGALVLRRGVTLRGDGRNDTVIAGGDPTLTATCVTPMDITVEGIGLVNGGGVVNQGCHLTVRDGLISGHSAHGSGAGVSNAGQLVLADVEVRNNTARVAGGGLYNAAGAQADVRDATFTGNTAGQGGGAVFSSGDLTVKDSTLRDNHAKLGAGVSNDGTVTVRDSKVVANVAGVQGGGFDNAGTLRIFGSRVTRNEAGASGGGIFNREGATVTLTDTSLRANTPDDCAGTSCP